MQKRPNAVTFKGKPLTLVGPQLKPGDPLVLITPPGEPSWAIAAMLYE